MGRTNLERRMTLAAAFVAGSAFCGAAAQDPLSSAPAAFNVAGHQTLLVLHGVGAQIYECKTGAGAEPSWVFREPAAALFEDGQSMGHHFAGPTWVLVDGSQIKGKQAASAPGASATDVALLKLDVTQNAAMGALKDATSVLRLNTHGGALAGPCNSPGAFRSEAYAADYVFLR